MMESGRGNSSAVGREVDRVGGVSESLLGRSSR